MYEIVKSLRQYGESVVRTYICVDSETENFNDAVRLSKLLATAHTRLVLMPDPRAASAGEYWFFTDRNTYVTYYVREVSENATVGS